MNTLRCVAPALALHIPKFLASLIVKNFKICVKIWLQIIGHFSFSTSLGKIGHLEIVAWMTASWYLVNKTGNFP